MISTAARRTARVARVRPVWRADRAGGGDTAAAVKWRHPRPVAVTRGNVGMDVVLRTNSEDPALALRRVHRFADGSGFGALLVVRSRGFSAERPFYVEPEPVVSFLEAVGNMDRTLAGSLSTSHTDQEIVDYTPIVS